MSWSYKNNKCCNINLAIGKRGLWPDFLGKLRHLLPYHITYHTPARFHDLAYELCLIDRQSIDDKFYQMMKKKESTKWAIIYYILVKAFGFIFYKKN